MKRVFCFAVTVCFLVFFSANASAVEQDSYSQLIETRKNYLERKASDEKGEEIVEPQDAGLSDYTPRYYNQYISGPLLFGTWRNGVSGGNEELPQTIWIDRTYDDSLNINFTASWSGEYSLPNELTIEAALGIDIGKTKSYTLGNGSEITVPAGEHHMIVYRPAYYRYTVVEEKYMEAFIIGYGWDRIYQGTKTSYHDVFSHWDYGSVNLG